VMAERLKISISKTSMVKGAEIEIMNKYGFDVQGSYGCEVRVRSGRGEWVEGLDILRYNESVMICKVERFEGDMFLRVYDGNEDMNSNEIQIEVRNNVDMKSLSPT